MIDNFKAFLAGGPNWMGEAEQASWTELVSETLPDVIREWHDPDFAGLGSMNANYCSAARRKLVSLRAFKKNCPTAGEILQSLKLLADFFEDETRKAGLGKTTKKPPKMVVATPGAAATPPVVEVLEEGAIKEMHVSRRERNPELRKACIEHFRAKADGKIVCAACGLVFGEMYGEIGEGYIEVHHLKPISQTDERHEVDPATDLVPLCANCHAMIHRLMAKEKKRTGMDLEGLEALDGLRRIIEERR